MPTLHPASVAEYLDFGEYGYALSRFSGMWVGFKAISEIVESGASVAAATVAHLPRTGFFAATRRTALSLARICRARRSRSGWRPRSTRSTPSQKANPIDRHIYDVRQATLWHRHDAARRIST